MQALRAWDERASARVHGLCLGGADWLLLAPACAFSSFSMPLLLAAAAAAAPARTAAALVLGWCATRRASCGVPLA